MGRIPSRFDGIITVADQLTAAGTSLPVFFGDGSGKVDARDVGERRQPSKDVGEFGGEVFGVGLANGGGQLADLLAKPKKRGLRPAALVLLAVHAADERLKLG